MGPRNRSGVTDDNDPSDNHLVRSEIADRLGEWLCCRLDDLAKRKRKQVLCLAMEMLNPPVSQQPFGDRVAARKAVAIDHDLLEHAFLRHTVPNPVIEPVARPDVVIFARDQITEDVGTLVVGESEVPMKRLARGARHVVFWDQPSPCEISGIGWSHGWPELLTHS